MVFHKHVNMKKLLFIFSFVWAFSAYAQVPSITGSSMIKYHEADKTWLATVNDLAAYLAAGGGTVTNFSAGTLSPLFSTSVSNPTTTPALSFALTDAGASTWFGNSAGTAGAPAYNAAGALTKVDDANVTLTLGGTPATSLLKSVSITAGWTGQLSAARGGTGLSGVGSDVTLLGSNGSANIYYSLARTNTSAAIGWSRTGTTLNFNLPDADASFPGIVNTSVQTMAGNKTWTGTHTSTGLITGNGGISGVATASQAAINAAGVPDGDFEVITSSTTADHTDNLFVVGTLTADATITLPACNTTRDGWEYTILKDGADAFRVIIDPNSTETFSDGATTKSIYSQGNGARCKCRGSNNTWFFMAKL